MTNITSTVRIQDKIGETPIVIEVSRLKRKDAHILNKYFEFDPKTGEAAISLEKSVNMVDEMSSLLPQYVKSADFGGLTYDGVPLTINTIVEEVYFSPLLAAMVNKWVGGSYMNSKGEEAKNSEPLLPTTTTESTAVNPDAS